MSITSRLVGPFNLANILAAAATAIGLGIDPDTVARGIAALPGVPGRLERFGPPAGPGVFVDYAHTPAAVTQALAALETLDFSRLITVFGCGGDRDRSKRPLMGAAAAAGSHLVIVTSDNPRTEDPERIIADILTGIPGPAPEVVVDRPAAIARLCDLLASRPADEPWVALIAGKGHERYIDRDGHKTSYSDQDEVERNRRRLGW